jgi:hypothetical protein
LRIYEATEGNASLVTTAGRSLRTISLTSDGWFLSASVPKQNWRSIASIALRSAPADLKQLLTRSLRNKRGTASPLPICAETLSLLHLLRIVEGLDLQMAERIAEGWIQIPCAILSQVALFITTGGSFMPNCLAE